MAVLAGPPPALGDLPPVRDVPARPAVPAGPAPEAPERATVDREDDFPGPQVHVVYTVPSGRVDRALDSGLIQSSVAAAQAWFAEESDGARFRFDTFDGQLDVTFVALEGDDGAYSTGPGREAIERELVERGVIVPGKIYLVYHDGGSYVCGNGAWPPVVPGVLGALYLHGTPPGVPCNTNPLAAPGQPAGYVEWGALHEIAHTLGFVATCAPGHTRAGHVSAPAKDLMWGGPGYWELPPVLDDGRNDYFGHGRSDCPDLAQSPFVTLPDLVAEAELVSVRARRTGARRTVAVTLEVAEQLAGTVTLRRGQRALVTREVSLEAGRPGIVLRVPRTARKGPAVVDVVLADFAGNEVALSRSVTLPA
jgi:hypothetical protein